MRSRRLSPFASIALLGLIVLAAACGTSRPDDAASTPGVSASPPAAATSAAGKASTPAFVPPSEAEAERALAHVRALAGDIGARAAGTEGERRAAEYVRAQLQAAGYNATLETFTVDLPRDESQILDVPGAPQGMLALAMAGAPDGTVSGRVVPVGLGRADDFGSRELPGAIALAERGVIPFGEKALNAQRAGAVALVVANNQPGPFRGTIADSGERVTIPVVGVSSEDAELIDAVVVSGGRLTVRALRRSDPFPSQNVVGRPSDAPCTAYVGSHYDSVPQGPGANDNASGTASMLELARTHRVPGLCYLAFGSEEIGLEGSKAFVRDRGVGDERFMLNLDMMGKVRDPELVADSSSPASVALGDRASRIAAAAGVRIPSGTFPANTSSDHAPFARAGVPAITFYSGDDEFIHTPRDTIDNVALEDLRLMLRAASAVLRELLASER